LKLTVIYPFFGEFFVENAVNILGLKCLAGELDFAEDTVQDNARGSIMSKCFIIDISHLIC
jgi:hypothetical protein